MLYLTMYRELDRICTELTRISDEMMLWAWDKCTDVFFEKGYECAEDELKLGDNFDVVEWLRKDDDWSASDIVEYIKDSCGVDDILNNVDKYELLEHLYSEYSPEDFVCISWDY